MEKSQNVEKFRDELGYDVKITLKVAEGSPAKAILDTIKEENIGRVLLVVLVNLDLINY